MYKVGFLGFGNMASAIAIGSINANYLNEKNIYVYDIDQNQREKADKNGINVVCDEIELIEKSDIIFIGVKPQVVESVLNPMKEILKNKTIVSMVLGYDYIKYNEMLDETTRHLTIMPNTPLLVGEGMTLFEEKYSLLDEEYQFVKNMFSSMGEVEVIPNHLFAVAGTLSGCSPAFFYMVIEALADGAVKEGLPRNLAYKLASQTMLGSGKMQKTTSLHPGELKDNVCSPKGSTIKGVEALEQNNMRYAFMQAISKALHYK